MSNDPHVVVAKALLTVTPRERGEMGASWRLFQKNLQENGITVFYQFFKKHPEYQKLFRAFAKVPLDKLKHDPRLQAHANAVMYFISALIENMHDPQTMTTMLFKTGRNHKRDNVNSQSFPLFQKVLLAVMQEKLGPKLTPAAAAAWERTLGVLFETIEQGMNTTSSGTIIVPPKEVEPAEGLPPSDAPV